MYANHTALLSGFGQAAYEITIACYVCGDVALQDDARGVFILGSVGRRDLALDITFELTILLSVSIMYQYEITITSLSRPSLESSKCIKRVQLQRK